MKIDQSKHRIGKFQLPRQAHVLEVKVELEAQETLGMVTAGSKTLKLWLTEEPTKEETEELLAAVCPLGDAVLEDADVKRMVRATAELGDILHLQVYVFKGPNALTLHSFLTVKDFDLGMIEFHTMRRASLPVTPEE